MKVCIECMEDRDSEFCPECGEPCEESVPCASCGADNIPALQSNCHECEADLHGGESESSNECAECGEPCDEWNELCESCAAERG